MARRPDERRATMSRGRAPWLPAMAKAAVVAAMVAAAISAVSPGAEANWLTRTVREAGEASGKGGAKLGLGALDNAALHVRSLPQPSGGVVALAAHATPEGHWKFVNKAGEVYTAGTADEMKRVAAALAPDVAGVETRLSLHLSDETVLRQKAMLKELPATAKLHVVIGKDSFPLLRRAEAGSERLYAEVRPHVAVLMSEERLVAEAIHQMSRPLEASRMRVLSLTPGGPDSLKTVPRYDAASKGALVDEIDPNSLGRALGSLKGQTAVLTGRIEAGQFTFRPVSGPERSLPMAEIGRAAAAADVNLVVLQSAAASQPGGRNWLWQKVAVAGLDDALKRATFADFLNALGAGRGQLAVEAVTTAEGRTLLRALPDGPRSDALTGPIGSQLGDWMADAAAHVTGNVVIKSVEVWARSADRQRELDARWIPGIPSFIQVYYLGCLVCGLIAWPVTRRWWGRTWPAEARSEYGSGFGYRAARVVRGLVFVLLFLPLAGGPALLASVAMQLWGVLTAPYRFVRWLIERWSGRAAAN